jgi:hypothetical protein
LDDQVIWQMDGWACSVWCLFTLTVSY